ncbi:MAG: hypothetical protein HY231_07475 [Acidobacteria bacterium]|nr:hypothetical protein [Acidobacteriota bacterium]
MELQNAAFFLLASLGWLLFSYLFISIGEHQIHKHFMHRKRLFNALYKIFPYLVSVFEAHAVRHHARWYKEFDYEPDDYGRQENLDIKVTETVVMTISTAPLWVWMFFVSISGGCIFLAAIIIHNRLWNVLHRQMHIPQNVFFKDWALFRYLARNHFMHHRKSNKNYNVVLPLADFLFRTKAQPTQADIREMLRLGYLQPTSDRVQELIDRWREATDMQREQAADASA